MLAAVLAGCPKVPGFILAPLTYVDCKKYKGRNPPCDLELKSYTSPAQLGSYCLANPNCKAFLTNGWLKSASGLLRWQVSPRPALAG